MTHQRTKIRDGLYRVLKQHLDGDVKISKDATEETMPKAGGKAVVLILPISDEPSEDEPIGSTQSIDATISIAVYGRGENVWDVVDDACADIEQAILNNPSLHGTVTSMSYAGFDPGDLNVEGSAGGLYLGTLSYTGQYTRRNDNA